MKLALGHRCFSAYVVFVCGVLAAWLGTHQVCAEGGADEGRGALHRSNIRLTVERNCIIEWSCYSEIEYRDAFADVELNAVLTDADGAEFRLPAFWAGGNEWRFRFSSPHLGEYQFRTACNDVSNERLHARRGRISVIEYTGGNDLLAHGPLKLYQEGRLFRHQDGHPFLWLADSWWHGMTSRLDWPDGFQLLTADRKEKGFSVIQLAIAFPCDIQSFDPRGANAAGHAWTPGYQTINPEYFDLVDQRIAWLVREGLVPNIVGAWGYYLPEMGVEKMKRHWRYLIARYGAYPVTWTLCGEAVLPWYLLDNQAAASARQSQREGWGEVASYVRAIDPYQRLRSVHPGPASGGLRPLADMDALDFVMIQPGHKDASVATAADHLDAARKLYPGRPVLIGEACFEGMNGECKEKIQRILFWSSMLTGAPGFSYGADGIWQFNCRDNPFGPSPGGQTWGNAAWDDAYRWPGSAHVGAGRRILLGYSWEKLTSNPEWISNPATIDEPRGAYAAGIGDRMRMIYFPNGVAPWRVPPVVRQLAPNTSFQARYIDPMSTQVFPLGEITTDAQGGWEAPPTPVLHDWLLVLTGAERG
ncbi:DUF5060 domain-containing protein [Pirellulimonas nuda]|uniref:DUF5060 domain-containing protein n=1 Tax=Pirellulimonas nuda TaxID=2528009 RepID=UPI001E606661|nr:DUF5060 domain-containing protein [Pirellulimonas nuda]